MKEKLQYIKNTCFFTCMGMFKHTYGFVLDHIPRDENVC